MARALRTVLEPGLLTVIVNVGDDTERYGVHVSADPDTVIYTLAGEQGEHGWEDIELGYRLWRQGYPTVFSRNALVYRPATEREKEEQRKHWTFDHLGEL